ncbi:MAG: DUF58 domain-containing protein [Clostridia bacterium]|nr:DUF58 domain-containing protein [Clostridia bacterium]MBQ8369541.1 DUF58 domain-containing protein [Clostridia bacterium]
MADRRFLYILGIAGCLTFYLAYQKWFAWIVLMAVLLLPWLSLILSLRAMLSTKLRLKVPEKLTQESDAQIRLEARFSGVRPPLKCRIRVIKPITGESWLMKSGDALPTEHCGGLIVRTETAKVYDWLGLFSLNVRKPPSSTVRVMPSPKEIPIPGELSQYLARAWRPKHGGGYAENHEIRPYRPGDTLNLVHWKLSAKVDEMMLREPMEPDQGLMLLTIDISGTPDELDRKFTRLISYGERLLGRGAAFEVLALTGNGLESWFIREQSQLADCVDDLLCAPYAPEGSLTENEYASVLRYHIGGEPDED